MTQPLKAWIQAALKAREIVDAAANRRDGLAAASQQLEIGKILVKRLLDLLAYVRQHAPLSEVKASQTKLEIFRSVERADPVRGSSLRQSVFANELTLGELQVELEKTKIRAGARKPLPLTLEEVLALCARDLPDLGRLTPPTGTMPPDGDALWIGVDLEWELNDPYEPTVPIWCAMISFNIACARIQKGSFFDFILRVNTAGLRYRAISVVLASEQERQLLMKTLKWVTKRVSTTFFLHVIATNTMVRVGSRRNPFAEALGSSAAPSASPHQT